MEQFVSQVIVLQAQRQVKAELLMKINQGIPVETQHLYNELIAKREAETLTVDEHQNLLRLSEQVEKLQAQRIEYLVELARIRGISLTACMENLGIKISEY